MLNRYELDMMPSSYASANGEISHNFIDTRSTMASKDESEQAILSSIHYYVIGGNFYLHREM
jgi:hypothetical protein